MRGSQLACPCGSQQLVLKRSNNVIVCDKCNQVLEERYNEVLPLVLDSFVDAGKSLTVLAPDLTTNDVEQQQHQHHHHGTPNPNEGFLAANAVMDLKQDCVFTVTSSTYSGLIRDFERLCSDLILTSTDPKNQQLRSSPQSCGGIVDLNRDASSDGNITIVTDHDTTKSVSSASSTDPQILRSASTSPSLSTDGTSHSFLDLVDDSTSDFFRQSRQVDQGDTSSQFLGGNLLGSADSSTSSFSSAASFALSDAQFPSTATAPVIDASSSSTSTSISATALKPDVRRRATTSQGTVESHLMTCYFHVLDLCTSLGLERSLGLQAFDMIKRYSNKASRHRSVPSIHHRNLEKIATSALILACRLADEPLSEGELQFMTSSQPMKEYDKFIKYIQDLLGIISGPSIISNHVIDYCVKLGLDDTTRDVSIYLGETVLRSAHDSRRTPPSIAAAAVYIVTMLENNKKRQIDMCRAANITEVTLRKVFKEFIAIIDDLLPEGYIPKKMPDVIAPHSKRVKERYQLHQAEVAARQQENLRRQLAVVPNPKAKPAPRQTTIPVTPRSTATTGGVSTSVAASAPTVIPSSQKPPSPTPLASAASSSSSSIPPPSAPASVASAPLSIPALTAVPPRLPPSSTAAVVIPPPRVAPGQKIDTSKPMAPSFSTSKLPVPIIAARPLPLQFAANPIPIPTPTPNIPMQIAPGQQQPQQPYRAFSQFFRPISATIPPTTTTPLPQPPQLLAAPTAANIISTHPQSAVGPMLPFSAAPNLSRPPQSDSQSIRPTPPVTIPPNPLLTVGTSNGGMLPQMFLVNPYMTPTNLPPQLPSSSMTGNNKDSSRRIKRKKVS